MFCLYLGDVVEDVRTVFENMSDTTVYIPSFIHGAITVV